MFICGNINIIAILQVLLSWLESLPKSDSESLEHGGPPSPGPGSHNNSIDSNINTINRRNQTLTRTNPYRHKVSVACTESKLSDKLR